MDWQQLASLAIVSVTALAFLAAAIRRRRSPAFLKQRGGPCGCSGDKSSRAQLPTFMVQGKKGEPAKVTVRQAR